jgi:outer membrane protein OmpA-like peptidoglycan-associated protein
MELDHRGRGTAIDRPAQDTASAVGKQTLTMALPDAAPARGAAPVQRLAAEASPGAAAVHAAAQDGLAGPSAPLPHLDRIQRLFGRHDVGGVQAHVGGPAAAASEQMGARAYATGHHVAFASSPDLHTAAHEAAHVVQQRAGVQLKDAVGSVGDSHEQHADAVADRVVRGESAEGLLDQYGGGGGGGGGVQFSLIGNGASNAAFQVPGMGNFNINMVTTPAAAAGARAGLDGFIQFTPITGAPNSNTIGIVQIVKDTDAGNPASDRGLATMPPLAAPRGALGQPGLRTADDPATGVVGGFATDIYHQGGPAGLRAPGTAASPRYAFEPSPAGTPAQAGAQPGPRGGTGGVFSTGPNGLTPGFKRSDDPADIRSAALYDTPGSAGNADFEFESVARGEDTQVDYGTIKWGFGTRAGAVTNEHVSVVAGSSATFANAMDRHRDFYVHEPVTLYFAFDHDDVAPAEDAKIAGLAGYLARNPAVQMTLDGFADQIGNAAYNVNLSQRRVNHVRAAILTHFPAAHVAANTVVPAGGHGISTAATDATSEQPAGTGDQGGSAALGADQSREANRQFNRRVTIAFSHPAGTGPAAPGGVGNPAPAPAGGGGGGGP